MKIFVFGNEDLEIDSIPLKILPKLKEIFPEIIFDVKDPNEEWDVPENMVILDTAIGVKNVTIFESLDKFSSVPRVSMHDFDALSNIRYLYKLGKIKKVKIIGISPNIGEDEAISRIAKILKEIHE